MMLQRAKLGMVMFLLNEAVFFFMLIAAFVYMHAATIPGAAHNLNLRSTTIFTVCLLASSLTLCRAAASAEAERSASLHLWLGGTIVLGVAFLYGQSSEYLRLFQQNVTISRDVFGSAFFTLTAFHGLHVMAGIAMLGTAWGLVIAGDSGKQSSCALEILALYWYFVVIVWIAIFAIVYLGMLL